MSKRGYLPQAKRAQVLTEIKIRKAPTNYQQTVWLEEAANTPADCLHCKLNHDCPDNPWLCRGAAGRKMQRPIDTGTVIMV